MHNPLPPNLIVGHADGGHLLHNIASFAALLRQSGIDSGIDKTAAAATALAQTGIDNRNDVFWALASVFVCRREQRPLFRHAFDIFWRGLSPNTDDVDEELLTSTTNHSTATASHDSMPTEQLPNQLHGATDSEHLHDKDFEQMGEAEWQQAMKINRQLTTTLPLYPTRRFITANDGIYDMRRMVRRALRHGDAPPTLLYKRRCTNTSHVIMLLDISGSMSVYARAFVHFAAALLSSPLPHRLFLFGTKLTAARIRPQHKTNIANTAINITAAANDWDGGTRLSPLLQQFNHQWLRRCQISQAIVLFISDGLEVNCDEKMFGNALDRLQKSCRRLIWLNPLLRYQQYAPLARGARLLSRYANQTHSIHNVRAIADLSAMLKHDFMV